MMNKYVNMKKKKKERRRNEKHVMERVFWNIICFRSGVFGIDIVLVT